MYLMRILLSLYLLCLINGGRSEPQYVLSVPAMLRSEHTEKLCLNLVGHEEALNLNVVLEYHEENITIFAENVPATNYFQCNNFSVPQVTETEPVFVTFSAIGESIKFQERKTVVIASMKNIYKFQMDKPLYKAGQNVQFRLISLSAQLLPVNEKYSMIYLTDPLGSRIAQWPDQVAQHGIVSLNYQLISDATPGSYGLTAERESGYPLKQRFTVEEYVLPRLTMTVNSPSTLSVLDEFLPFNVSTRYTYGQPVPGSVSGKWCRMPSYSYGRRSNCNKNKDGICFDITGKLGPDGTYQGVVDLKPFHMELSGFEMSLSLDLTMTEEGSGNQLRENRNVWITSQLAKIRLESPSSSYKRGINYTMIAILEDHNGRPLSGEEIEMEIIGEKIQKLKTDAEGKAKYEIDTSNYVAPNFTVKASYKNPDQCYYSSWKEYPDYPVAERTVQRFYSKSGSFLDVSAPTEELRCGQNHKIDVRYKLTRDGVGKEASEVTFYYQVLSKTMIVHSGSRKVDYKDEKQSTFSFDLPVSSDNAPRFDLIVYSILQKEVIVDTVRMNTEKCFKNPVSLGFSKEQGAPGSNVDLMFSAAPEGICAFRVIDSSLLILNSYESFTAENMYNSIPYMSLYGYNVGSFNVEDPPPPCEDPDKQIFYNGNYYLPVSSKKEEDSYSKIKKIGLIFKTGAIMRKSEVCSKEETYFDIYPKPRAYAKSAKPLSADMAPMASSMEYASMDADIAPGAAGPGAIETVRKNFVENWIWTTATVDSKGNGKLPLVVPDTITGWQGSGFCLSGKEGFGMSRYPANFTSFMPFFVELSLPNSIVRGEMLELRSSVPNYMEHCIKITVTLETSSDYEAKLEEGKLESCICSGEKAYNTWLITAKKIGEISFSVTAATSHIGKSCDGPSDPSQPSRKDTVIKSLIVEAEGIRKEVTTSNLICVEDTNSETTMEINPHETVVRGSEKAFVTILGDPLGLPLQNLRYLLQMPYGCAEQNLARMAPISCVLEYLNKTGQLTEEILTKAKSFLTEAYVRQLGFRMRSGPYNLFGGQQAKGNSWLTAYTYKTFEEAKKYIFIDPNVQKQSLIWLERSQKLENGCFQPTGRPFMNRGGTHDYLSFTAYLDIAMMESNYALTKPLLKGTMNCLVHASTSNQTLYNRALMLYSFTLHKNWEKRDWVLKQIKKEAISKRGTIHWESKKHAEGAYFSLFPSYYSSDALEITSYVLLSLAKGPNINQEELSYIAQIALWILQQQNSQGGFRSSQDTVVALQALSAYAQLIYKPNSHHNVVVRSGNAAVKSGNQDVSQFILRKDNRLLVQRQPLPKIPGHYRFDVRGRGCCLVQTTVQYNIPVPKENSAFSLSVSSSPKSCVNGVAHSFDLNASISYQGTRNETNMVIIEIKMLSGYSADYWSLRELVNSKKVSKTEEQNGRVILYMNSVSRETTQLTFKVQMGNRVLNVKEASAKCYDYYQAEENAAATYRHPCAVQA